MNVHVYPTSMRNESRMLRITDALARHGVFGEIVLLGVHEETLPRVERLDPVRRIERVPRPEGSLGAVGRAWRTIDWARRATQLAETWRPTCVNAHSLSVLPACARLARETNARLIYDTHELETETIGSRGLRKVLAKMTERRLIGRVDAISVVNREIADWYERRYGLRGVTVIRNVPLRPSMPPKATGALRRSLGVPEDAFLFLYQGILSPGRGLRSIVDAFAGPGRHHVLLVGYGPLEAELRARALGNPRIHVHPAVPPGEITSLTVEADVGIALIEDVCLSYRLCLPNKLFEYVNAGLPVIVSESPAMVRVVRDGDIGWVIPQVSGESLRRFVEDLEPTALAATAERSRAARGRHAWEDEEPELLRMYDRLGFTARS